MSWSRRPGLRMAGSMMSGLFVAPMMKTFFLLDIPSISVRIWLMTRSAAPPPSPTLPPRALAMESSSSKKRTHGAAWRAWRHHTDTQNGLKSSAELDHLEWNWLQSVKLVVSRRLFTTILPCQRSLWHWPQTLQTTWWAAQVLWWRWNLPGTHLQWLWPAESYHNQGDRRTAHPWRGSCRTWGTCLGAPLGTEFLQKGEEKHS